MSVPPFLISVFDFCFLLLTFRPVINSAPASMHLRRPVLKNAQFEDSRGACGGKVLCQTSALRGSCMAPARNNIRPLSSGFPIYRPRFKTQYTSRPRPLGVEPRVQLLKAFYTSCGLRFPKRNSPSFRVVQ